MRNADGTVTPPFLCPHAAMSERQTQITGREPSYPPLLVFPAVCVDEVLMSSAICATTPAHPAPITRLIKFSTQHVSHIWYTQIAFSCRQRSGSDARKIMDSNIVSTLT